MIKQENEKLCNLDYLSAMVNGKNHLIIEIMDVFLKQIPEELKIIDQAIIKEDFATIKSYAHTMKSSVSIMSIKSLVPILKEMEDLSEKSTDIERIQELNKILNLLCSIAIEEVEEEKLLM